MMETNDHFKAATIGIVGIIFLFMFALSLDQGGMANVTGLTTADDTPTAIVPPDHHNPNAPPISPQEKKSRLTSFIDEIDIHLAQGSAFGSGLWMLMDKETRYSWQNNILGQFAQGINVRYWISETCRGATSLDPGSGGTLQGDLGGMPFTFVTVTAQRATWYHPNESNTSHMVTEYFYKFEYYANNPKDVDVNANDEMKFDVVLYNEFGRVGKINPETITVADGETKSRTGTDMIRRESRHHYTSVCLEFTRGIRDFNGNERSSVCNIIVELDGPATGVGAGSSPPPSSSDTLIDW